MTTTHIIEAATTETDEGIVVMPTLWIEEAVDRNYIELNRVVLLPRNLDTQQPVVSVCSLN